MTDYEKKLETMNGTDLIHEIEDAVTDAALYGKPVFHERVRMVRRVLARRLNFAANLAA